MTSKADNGRKVPPTWRRQFNESFQNHDGSFSPAKSMAIVGQGICLWHLNLHFSELIAKWDALLVVLTFIVAPDVFKKFLNLKYGAAK